MIRLLRDATATNSPPVNVAASGTINAVSGANTAVGDTFTIWDGLNAVTFRFVTTTFTATDVLRPIVYVGSETATQMGDLIVTALAAATLARCTGSNSSGAVTVTKTYFGPAGNGRIDEAVANASFTVVQFRNGAFAGFMLHREGPLGNTWQGGDLGILQLRLAGTGAISVTIAIWLNSEVIDRYVLHGSMNEGSAITGTTSITRSESIRGLSAGSHIYAEVVAISGTGATVNLGLTERNL
jgi:hypothetical protein